MLEHKELERIKNENADNPTIQRLLAHIGALTLQNQNYFNTLNILGQISHD